MSSWRLRAVTTAMWAVVVIAIIILMNYYFQFVSTHIYEESSQNLTEVYAQVDNNFDQFLNQNWRNLEDWYEIVDTEDPETARQKIEMRKELWGFSDFYFFNANGHSMTIGGASSVVDLGEERSKLFYNNLNIMDNEALADGTHITILAVPVPLSKFDSFSYDAIGVSYTNSDISKSLNTNAFDGSSTCFIVKANGSVILSTQEGGTVFNNYLSYLNAGSDLSDEQLADLQSDWALGKKGVITFNTNSESFYLAYQPVDYNDYILLGIVPETAISASIFEVQKATIDVILKVFLLVGVALIVQIVMRYRKRARQSALELKYRDLMFSTLSANVDDISIMIDEKTWKADYVSPNVERLLGVPAGSVLEDLKSLEKCRIEEQDGLSFNRIADIPLGEYQVRDEEHINISSGQKRWFHESIYHLSVGGKNKFIIVLSDRTQERKMTERLENALESAKMANQAKSDFLSSMSHDIRTPMNAIMGFIELLYMNADDPEKVRAYVKKIDSSGNHLLNLINDILDMSKIESGKTSISVERFDLYAMIQDLEDIMVPQASAKDQAFEISVDDKLNKYIMGDKLRVYQILINLLSNAVKYTPDGGHISFTVEQAETKKNAAYETIRFTIEDNGYGMDKEFLKTIFEPFTRETSSTTNKIQGTGLGMAITKNLIDLMGGYISVDSELGKGSTFVVELSFGISDEQESSVDEEVEERFREDALSGLNILLVEDNDMGAEMLGERLDIEGASVNRAHNGQEAVDMFAEAAPGTYDLILMDVEMPVMGGYDATKTIRALDKEEASSIPIFAMTANVFADDIKKALEAGMNLHLAKPVDINALKAGVDKFVKVS